MKYYLGIDLGGTNIRAGIVDESYTITALTKTKTKMPRPAEEIVNEIVLCAQATIKEAGLTAGDIQSVGLGAPGTVDQKTGRVEYANNLPFLALPIKHQLESQLGLPVFLENDANAAALAEMLCGAAKGAKNAALVTLGTGVGCGIIIDGKIYTGHHFAAGEAGHIGVAHGGRPCTCGRTGCLEAYASVRGLIETTKEEMQKAPGSIMWQLCEGDINKASGRTAFLAAKDGDKAGEAAVARFIEFLGYGIANIVNILAPEVLAIGGGLSGEGEGLINPLIQVVKPQLYQKDEDKQTKLVLATLGNSAGIIGAAMLGTGHETN